MSAFQQGRADGLCGLYAILNYLRELIEYDKDEPTDILFYLLESARAEGCFTPLHITEGFQDYELKRIIDRQIENWRLPLKTHFLADIKSTMKIATVAGLLERVLKAGGAAIVHSEKRNHWLLVTTNAGKAEIYDSDRLDTPVQPFKSSSKAFSPKWGFVILPDKRVESKVDI